MREMIAGTAILPEPFRSALLAELAQQHARAWIVGGTLRDWLLGLTALDVDLAVDGDGCAIARATADRLGRAYVELDQPRGVGRVVDGALVLDIASLRGNGIEADLRLRDFSINALALAVQEQVTLIDPCNGLQDLQQRQLRACSDSLFVDDPLRLLRAVRLAATLEFTISPELHLLIQRDARLATQPAPERQRDELMKLLSTRYGSWGLRYLDATGLLTQLIPELEPARNCEQPNVHFLPVLAHLLESVCAIEWLIDGLAQQAVSVQPDPAVALPQAPGLQPALACPVAVRRHGQFAARFRDQEQLQTLIESNAETGWRRSALLKFATLVHDIAKPQTKAEKPDGGVSFYGHQELGSQQAEAISRRLRLSRAATQYIGTIVREHMRPGQLAEQETVTLRAIRRLFRDAAGAGPELLLHSLADHMATRGPRLTQAAWAEHIAWTDQILAVLYHPPVPAAEPLVRGEDVMAELDIPPGPRVGQLLEEIHEAQAAGEISNRDEALELLRQLARTEPT